MTGRCDAHIHLFRQGFGGQAALDSELQTYLRLRREHNVSAALVVGYEGQSDYVGNNRDIIEYARAHSWMHPLIFVPDGCDRLPPEAEDARCAGFALYPKQPVRPAIWQLADERGWLVSVNVPAAEVELISGARALTEGQVLLSHLGLPGDLRGLGVAEVRERLSGVLALAANENVLLKLSGLYAMDPCFPHNQAQAAVQLLIEAFGVHRMCWGSDFSPALVVVSPEQMMTLPPWLSDALSTAERDAIMGENLAGAVAAAGSRVSEMGAAQLRPSCGL